MKYKKQSLSVRGKVKIDEAGEKINTRGFRFLGLRGLLAGGPCARLGSTMQCNTTRRICMVS